MINDVEVKTSTKNILVYCSWSCIYDYNDIYHLKMHGKQRNSMINIYEIVT